jgi:uncharacterized protein (DUF2126 family)
VTGFTEGRYVLTCNGRRLPLRNTGRKGEYVDGVRYRAWQPPSVLHPTIGPHVPLVVDVIDTWNGHSVGGCAYHVAHPGGRSYDALPVNSYEAEARRVTRFWNFGHTPCIIIRPPMIRPIVTASEQQGLAKLNVNETVPRPMAPPIEELNHEYPFTMDLRHRGE